MTKQTYFFPLGPGVDAEVTIECRDGEVTHEHVRTLGRYLVLYLEALGGTPDNMLMLEAPQKRKGGRKGGIPVCATCGQHARASIHISQECLYTTPLRTVKPETRADEEEAEEEEAEAEEEEAPVDGAPPARRPYINQAGVLCIDTEHTAVSYDVQEGRYKILHPGVGGHIHEYVTGRNADIGHEVLATCTGDGCSHTIMMTQEDTSARAGV